MVESILDAFNQFYKQKLIIQAETNRTIMKLTKMLPVIREEQRRIDQNHILLGSKNIRDAIISTVAQVYKRDVFTTPFIKHLSKFGKKSLDEFSELEFMLSDHGVRLVFKTSRFEKNEMTYTATNLAADPDPALAAFAAKWF